MAEGRNKARRPRLWAIYVVAEYGAYLPLSRRFFGIVEKRIVF
jgi:hypothetical protein